MAAGGCCAGPRGRAQNAEQGCGTASLDTPAAPRGSNESSVQRLSAGTSELHGARMPCVTSRSNGPTHRGRQNPHPRREYCAIPPQHRGHADVVTASLVYSKSSISGLPFGLGCRGGRQGFGVRLRDRIQHRHLVLLFRHHRVDFFPRRAIVSPVRQAETATMKCGEHARGEETRYARRTPPAVRCGERIETSPATCTPPQAIGRCEAVAAAQSAGQAAQ